MLRTDFKPETFPTQGPRSMQFLAYDPNRYDVCEDSDCGCRGSLGNTCAYGATEQEALEAFWEAIDERI